MSNPPPRRTFVKDDADGNRIVQHATTPSAAVRLAFDGWREETPAPAEPPADQPPAEPPAQQTPASAGGTAAAKPDTEAAPRETTTSKAATKQQG